MKIKRHYREQEVHKLMNSCRSLNQVIRPDEDASKGAR
jgi:hypothetical protein